MRLDSYLANKYPNLSRSQLQQYIRRGFVSVNGAKELKPSTIIAEADQVNFECPKPRDFALQIKQFAACNLIYEDNNVIVINKPAGLLVHAKGGIDPEFTVADFVRSRFNPHELAENSNNNRLGIVHRLDRSTSGVMICAKNISTASMLSRQFAERQAHKVYLAITESAPKELHARIDLPIGRNPSKPATFRVDGAGKQAVTDYQVKRVNDDGTVLVELHPQTGRTHQLRIHLSYLGCPIVGDPVYGHGQFGGRLMLHAWKLEISIPGDSGRQRRTFVADPPEEFGL